MHRLTKYMVAMEDNNTSFVAEESTNYGYGDTPEITPDEMVVGLQKALEILQSPIIRQIHGNDKAPTLKAIEKSLLIAKYQADIYRKK